MSLNVTKLTSRQLRAIESLLRCGTIAEAAAACRVTARTLFRWLNQPDFANAYREARMRTVETSISELQTATSEAVDTLRRNLSCENPHAEIAAAKAIIEFSLKGIELADMVARLERLEELHRAGGNKKWAS